MATNIQISEGKKSGSIRGKDLKWKHWILWIWGAKRGQMVRISLGRGTNKIDRNTNCEIIWNPIFFPAATSAAKYTKSARFYFDKSTTQASINSKRRQRKSWIIIRQISLKLLNKSSSHFCPDPGMGNALPSGAHRLVKDHTCGSRRKAGQVIK